MKNAPEPYRKKSGIVSAGVGGVFGKAANAWGAAGQAAVSSAVTQGIGVATGLQSKFDFVGVAAAAVAAGVGHVASKELSSKTYSLNDAGRHVAHYNLSVGGKLLSGAASTFANAATRSALTGTSFGENLVAAIPDTIASMIRDVVSGATRSDHVLLEKEEAAFDARVSKLARSKALPEELRGSQAATETIRMALEGGATGKQIRTMIADPDAQRYMINNNVEPVTGPYQASGPITSDYGVMQPAIYYPGLSAVEGGSMEIGWSSNLADLLDSLWGEKTAQDPSVFIQETFQNDVGAVPGYREDGIHSWRAANDLIILQEVNRFNLQHGFALGDSRYLDARLVKAMAMQESGGTPGAFASDPLTANNPGDWSATKTTVTGLTGPHQVMTPRLSIRAGIAWLYYKDNISDGRGNTTWIGWDRAVGRYNGRTDLVNPTTGRSGPGGTVKFRDYYASRIRTMANGASLHCGGRIYRAPADQQLNSLQRKI